MTLHTKSREIFENEQRGSKITEIGSQGKKIYKVP